MNLNRKILNQKEIKNMKISKKFTSDKEKENRWKV